MLSTWPTQIKTSTLRLNAPHSPSFWTSQGTTRRIPSPHLYSRNALTASRVPWATTRNTHTITSGSLSEPRPWGGCKHTKYDLVRAKTWVAVSSSSSKSSPLKEWQDHPGVPQQVRRHWYNPPTLVQYYRHRHGIVWPMPDTMANDGCNTAGIQCSKTFVSFFSPTHCQTKSTRPWSLPSLWRRQGARMLSQEKGSRHSRCLCLPK